MTSVGREARAVRHALTFPAEPPAGWRCRICGNAGSSEGATPCEGACRGWLHWPSYWPGILSSEERAAFSAAQAADLRASRHLVWVSVEGRRLKLPASMVRSAEEDYLEHQIVLCPGCRS
jgi:hypothetical protein